MILKLIKIDDEFNKFKNLSEHIKKTIKNYF